MEGRGDGGGGSKIVVSSEKKRVKWSGDGAKIEPPGEKVSMNSTQVNWGMNVLIRFPDHKCKALFSFVMTLFSPYYRARFR